MKFVYPYSTFKKIELLTGIAVELWTILPLEVSHSISRQLRLPKEKSNFVSEASGKQY